MNAHSMLAGTESGHRHGMRWLVLPVSVAMGIGLLWLSDMPRSEANASPVVQVQAVVPDASDASVPPAGSVRFADETSPVALAPTF